MTSDLPPPTGPAVPMADVPTQPVPAQPAPAQPAPSGRGGHRGRIWLVVGAAAIALVVGAVLGARAGSSGDDAAVRPAATEPDSTDSTDTTEAAPPVTDRPPTTVAAPTTIPVPVTYGEGIMPDVVCMNLQAAQDEIQEHGVFYSRSRDATGEGRRQIIDRNWIVVAQDPAPGTPIGEGDAMLSVVKTDEPNPC